VAALAAAFPNPPEFKNWPLCAKLVPHAENFVEGPVEFGEPLACVLSCVGDYLHQQAQYARAEPLLRRALAILETSLPDHPNTVMARSNLAGLLAKMGKAP
jgi:hypothetical protein